MELSSCQGPTQLVELSTRHGTSGKCVPVWPDHSHWNDNCRSSVTSTIVMRVPRTINCSSPSPTCHFPCYSWMHTWSPNPVSRNPDVACKPAWYTVRLTSKAPSIWSSLTQDNSLLLLLDEGQNLVSLVLNSSLKLSNRVLIGKISSIVVMVRNKL